MTAEPLAIFRYARREARPIPKPELYMTDDTQRKTLEVVQKYGAAFDAFTERQEERFADLAGKVDAVTGRVEEIEARGGGPASPNSPKRSTESFEFKTPTGACFSIPSHVKMTDVLGPSREPEISLERWLGATVAGEKCGDAEALAFAREAKQLTTGTSGVLIPAQYIDAWIDLLRARSVLVTAGAMTTTMEGKTQTSSAVTADPAASWHSEGGSISADNPTFAARTLTAQTLVVRCQASLELTQDSPDFGAQLANVMTGAMAAELDRVGLEGTGTPPEPEGIKNTTGRSSQTSVSSLTDYEEIVSGIGALLNANCDLDQVSRFAIMSPGSWTGYENLVTGISSDKTQLPRPKAIEDMRFLVTTNVAGSLTASPPVATTIYLGDFRDITLGIRREASIDQLRLTTYASNLLIEFVGYLRADWLVRRPASFHTIEGVAA